MSKFTMTITFDEAITGWNFKRDFFNFESYGCKMGPIVEINQWGAPVENHAPGDFADAKQAPVIRPVIDGNLLSLSSRLMRVKRLSDMYYPESDYPDGDEG